MEMGATISAEPLEIRQICEPHNTCHVLDVSGTSGYDTHVIDRRQFLLSTAVATATACSSSTETPEVGEAPKVLSTVEDVWGGPIIDIHAHVREDPDGNAAHCDGAGISHAVLLPSAPAVVIRDDAIDRLKATQARHPDRFVWSASADVTQPDAADVLTRAVGQGAIAFGELKSAVNADGPELQRLYALAAELDVPIMVHFQEYPPISEGGPNYAVGFKSFATMLEKYPNTKFVGHADAFWANISADYENQEAYPSTPIVPGGITDKLLGDYENMYGDLSANSGNNAMSRDPEFTAGFLERHQDKLLYGSDCFCVDGKGTGRDRGRLIGKCLSHETLGILKSTASPEAFRKITWGNTHRVYSIAV